MKIALFSLLISIASLLVSSCGSDKEAKTALNDAELTERQELYPVTADDISDEEYEAALRLVDNSPGSKFQYSTDASEIATLQKQESQSGGDDGFDKMVADFGGFNAYADFLESPDHSAEYIRDVHNRYGIEYTEVTEHIPHDSTKDNTSLGPMVRRDEFIGMTMRDASTKAIEQGYKNIRIIQVDDEYLPVSEHCESSRLNLWVSESMITDAKEDQC